MSTHPPDPTTPSATPPSTGAGGPPPPSTTSPAGAPDATPPTNPSAPGRGNTFTPFSAVPGRGSSTSRAPLLSSLVPGIAIAVLLVILGFAWGFTVSDLASTLSHIFLEATPEAKAILLFLVGPLFLWTLFQTFREWGRLRREINAVRQFQDRLQKLPARSGVVRQQLHQCLAGAARDSALYRAVEAIWNCRHLTHVDMDALLSAAAQVESARANAGKTVPNRLLLLSLLGTIIGLAGVVTSLEPQVTKALNTNEAQTLLQGLSTTLNKMGTAFASTAWGILFSATIAGIQSALVSQRAHYIAAVEQVIVAEVAPLLLPHTDSTVIVEMRALIRQNYEELEQRLESLNQVGSAKIDQQLSQIDLVVRHGQTLLHNTELALNTLLQNQNQAFHTVTESLLQTTVALQQTTTGFDQAVRNADTLSADMAARLTRSTERLGQVSTGLETAIQNLEQGLMHHDKALATVVQSQQLSAAEQKKAQEAFLKVVHDFQAASQASVSVTQATLQSLRQESDGALRAITELSQRLTSPLPSGVEWADLLQPLGQMPEKLDNLAAGIQQLETVATALQALQHVEGDLAPLPSSDGSDENTPLPEQALLPATQQQQLTTEIQTLNQSVAQLSQRIHDLHQAMATAEDTPPVDDTDGTPDNPGTTKRSWERFFGGQR